MPGKTEQGLFPPSGAWQSCVLLSFSVQFLRILHSLWLLSECTPPSPLLVSLVFFPVHIFLSIYAEHYYLFQAATGKTVLLDFKSGLSCT